MEKMFELDITDIQIIVHKTETADFRFENPKREFDGFVLVTSGNGTVKDAQGAVFSLEKGDMLIISEGDRYSLFFEVPCSYVTSGLTLVTDKSLLPFIHKCGKREFDEILTICDTWQSHAWDSYTKSRIKLMNLYLDIISQNVLCQNEDRDVEKALHYIHSNFKSNFSGASLAAYCSVSLSYLRGKFLKQTGYTVLEYRDRLRILAAKEMLKSEYFSVTEIAAELGYCDVYHFSKVFKAHEGCPPSEWKKKG